MAAEIVVAWRIERQPSSLAVGWSVRVAVVWTFDELSVELGWLPFFGQWPLNC